MTRSKVNTTVGKIVLALAITLVLGAIPQLNITVASAEENKRTKIVMLIGSEGFMAPLSDAYGKLGDFPVDLELYNSNDLKDEGKTERLYNSIREADLFLLEMIGGTGVLALEPLLQELVDSDWPGTAISTRSTPFPEKLRVLDDSTGTLAKYFDNGGEENMRRMVLYLATTYGTISNGTVVTDEPLGPVVMPGRFIYHPDTVMSPTEGIYNTLDEYLAWYEGSGHYRDGAPWVGIITYDSSYKNSDYEMYTAMLNELENKGANVLLVFSDSDNRATVLHDFFMPDGKRQIDFLIAGVGFNYIFGLPEEGVNLFKQLNVPVMSPVYSSDLAEWEGSLAGITSEIPWQIAFPELDGRIEPVFIGGSTLQDIDENTGAELAKKMPLPGRIERATGRALAWVNLQQKRNADKRVALVYYNHHGGKDDIGASYLNSMASASVILEAMRDEGYTITGDLDTPAMESFMHGLGRNIGSWAPGELEAIVREGALLLPLEKYMAWYDQIPNELRYELEREWGPPPGDMMVYEGNLVIPGAIKGNVFVGPQPMRGWGEDPTKIAHSPTLPPPHQYIAFYFWLQHEFKADAVIHLGTHGTLEWLPGRSIGLGEDDWPDLLMGNLPDIYPYIVNNPGEGTQAKRRGYAVTIDHLTPPMIEPGLYGTLDELQQLITDYWSSTDKGNPERAVHLRGQIIEKVRENNLDQDLGIDLDKDDFQEAALFLHEYLEDLAVELMPYGLHTFGVPPEGEMLDLMVNSIVNYNASARGGSQGELKQKLLLTTDEIKNLLRVLKGEYLEPGLAKDPVRVPDILPTGKNLVTFDPRMVPDEAAWHVGKKAADELLEKYHAEHGHYPETVGVVLWAIETMRTD
ncbi:MAG TPA: cobaltochelatase subunit CobN, partial [Clostridia bacterium]|nr:cobaltochelatase subunit CobN [Clostridia bacterium]